MAAVAGSIVVELRVANIRDQQRLADIAAKLFDIASDSPWLGLDLEAAEILAISRRLRIVEQERVQ